MNLMNIYIIYRKERHKRHSDAPQTPCLHPPNPMFMPRKRLVCSA